MSQHERMQSLDTQKLVSNLVGEAQKTPQKSFLNNIQSAVKASPLLAGMLAGMTGCGGNVVVDQAGPNVTVVEGCDPVPECPAVHLVSFSPVQNDQNFFNSSGRWERVNLLTGEVIEVCNPIEKKNVCTDGENPQKDDCELPVCENVEVCDPIPSRQSKSGYRTPEKANFPTSFNGTFDLSYVYADNVNYPVIYDNTQDCKVGESPMGETYYSCDVIPTCPPGKQIAYCDPLPRCQEGQSPITCGTDAIKYSSENDCYNSLNSLQNFLNAYRLGLDPVIDKFCQSQFDPNLNETYYTVPSANIVCLPTPECKNGELPQQTTKNIPMQCGDITWTHTESYSLTCDPIPSCKK